MTYETYEAICELLYEVDAEGDPRYSVEEIAEMLGVTVEEVRYVDRAENDVM
jgi:hypothetical protein